MFLVYSLVLVLLKVLGTPTREEIKWDYMELGGAYFAGMDRITAFERGMRTWAKWVDMNVDATKTRVFFQSISPAHYNARPKSHEGIVSNGEASYSKNKFTNIDDILKGLVEWLCTQLRKPSHPTRGVLTAVNSLATLMREPVVRSSFVHADGVKLLVPLISPASTQQSIQLLYETCLCVWLLSFYEPAVEYLATTRTLPRLAEVVKSSIKEKVVRVAVLILRNLLSKGTFGIQMVNLGLPQIVQNLKAQAWSDEDLLEALNQLEVGLKDNLKKLSLFDRYKQEVLLGHLDWSPMHKDPIFWRENITNFEENDFQWSSEKIK